MRLSALLFPSLSAVAFLTGCSSVTPVDTSKVPEPLATKALSPEGSGTTTPSAPPAAESEPPPAPPEPPKKEETAPQSPAPANAGTQKSLNFGNGESRSVGVPESFVIEKPSSGMRLAQISVPHPNQEHAAAELVLFALGGALEDNIERWKVQCGGPDSFKGKQEIDTAAGIKAALCEFEGTYTPMTMGGPPAKPVPDARMFMAVIFTEQAQYQIRLVGPKATVDANKEKFFTLVKSFK